MRKIIFLFFFLLMATSVFAKNTPVLMLADEQLYQEIFELQNAERWKDADKKIAKLQDKNLMGHVLAQRYFSKTWKTSSQEIEKWFKKYADHPQAIKMYSLGQKKNAKLPDQKPIPVFGNRSGACSIIFRAEPIDSIKDLSFSYLSKDRRKRAQKTMNQIYKYIKSGKTLMARQLIDGQDAKELFNKKDHDSAKIALAFFYFLDGMDDKVLELITPAVIRSGKDLPLGHWTLGLSAWRIGKIELASSHFDKVANHPKAYPLLKAAGAFWASRANLKLGNFTLVNSYLEIAAMHPRTFYGILATRALGRDLNLTWEKPVLPDDEVTEAFSHPALERVLALKQIGFETLANQELTSLFISADKPTKALLSIVAERNGIERDLTLISGQLEDQNEGVRFPAPDWNPQTGWQVDKALVFAFIKQESCFNVAAKSNVGAVGLMQIMPDNAKQLAKILNIEWSTLRLSEPEYNMALGQQYILWLMKDRNIQNNLIFTAVAYNSGPRSLSKLKNRMKYNNDPLLFVESIPFRETRGFVERIMANYWIYRILMNQSVSSMDDLIEGRWPIYVALD